MLTNMHVRRSYQPWDILGTPLGRHGPARAASETLKAAIGRHTAPPATRHGHAASKKTKSRPTAAALCAAGTGRRAARMPSAPG